MTHKSLMFISTSTTLYKIKHKCTCTSVFNITMTISSSAQTEKRVSTQPLLTLPPSALLVTVNRSSTPQINTVWVICHLTDQLVTPSVAGGRRAEPLVTPSVARSTKRSPHLPWGSSSHDLRREKRTASREPGEPNPL